MAWNGSGTYSRTNGTATGSNVWAQDKAASRKITSTLHDNHDEDLADAINNCLAKDGQNAMTENLNMGGKVITNYGASNVDLLSSTTDTFTPTIAGEDTAGTVSYFGQNGYYVKLGDIVFFTIGIVADFTVAAVGQLQIGGLPFTVSTGGVTSGRSTTAGGDIHPLLPNLASTTVELQWLDTVSQIEDYVYSDVGGTLVNIDVNGWFVAA